MRICFCYRSELCQHFFNDIQIRITGPLAKTIDSALDMHRTGLDGRDGVGHAELNVARASSQNYSAEFLASCTLYTSVEPCCMCAGACYWAGIGTVVYAMTEKRLAVLTGDNPENLTLDLFCETVFEAGQRRVETRDPFAALEEKDAEGHRDFW